MHHETISPQNEATDNVAKMVAHLETLNLTLRRLGEDGVLQEILALLQEAVSRIPPRPLSRKSKSIRKKSEGALTLAQIEALREHVASCLSERISTQTLADIVGVNRNRFAILFNESFGVTPARFVKTARIQHAKQLLRETKLTLPDIAQHCGYRDQAQFTSSFREEAGMTPRRWRICSTI